jgi:HD superfamily phosphodiesterase
MISREQKRKIVAFANRQYRNNDRYHRARHIGEVVARALWLARMEHADRDACWASALLHDIAKSRRGDHGAIGAKEARALLTGVGVDGRTVGKVYDAIYFHNKGFSGGPIERRILWDSDKWNVFTSEGFRNRVVKCFEMTISDRKALARKLESEYRLLTHFHTKEGRKHEEKSTPVIERLISEMKETHSQ